MKKQEKLVKGPVVLYEQMRLKVLDLIKQRELKAHDPVPSEGELADMFGVSRRTSKEALELLAKEGIVYRLPRRGTFVAAGSLEKMVNHAMPLVQGETRTLAIVVPNLDEFTGQVVASALSKALASGCELLVRITEGQHETEDEVLKKLTEDKLVTGIIYFPGDRKTCGHEVLKLHIGGFPIVLVDRVFKEITIPSVYHDHFEGAYEITSHLISQGHQRIGMISEPIAGVVSREERYHGFLDAMQENQLLFSPHWLFEDIEIDPESKAQHAFTEHSLSRLKEFIENHSSLTALFCTNDHLAAACLNMIAASGLQVPVHLSVAGFTDLSIAEQTMIPLTTVRKSPNELGKQAVRLLLDYMDNPLSPPSSIQLKPELKIRASVGPANQTRL